MSDMPNMIYARADSFWVEQLTNDIQVIACTPYIQKRLYDDVVAENARLERDNKAIFNSLMEYMDIAKTEANAGDEAREKYKEALAVIAWYGDTNLWTNESMPTLRSTMEADQGQRARDFLKEHVEGV